MDLMATGTTHIKNVKIQTSYTYMLLLMMNNCSRGMHVQKCHLVWAVGPQFDQNKISQDLSSQTVCKESQNYMYH